MIHLEEGETVTLSNLYEGNYTTQLYVVIKITSYTTLNQITRKVSTTRADNSYGLSETYSLGSAGLYLAIGFQTRGTGGGTTYATISTSNDSETYELIRAGAILYGIYKALKKPDSERDMKLKRHQELLDNDNKRLKELEESNKIIM